MKKITNFAHTNKPNIMDTKKTFWVNQYGHRGQLMNSHPYNSLAEAKKDIEEAVTICGEHLPEKLRYHKVTDTLYQANNGGTIKIETNGDITMYVSSIWVAHCANYDKEIRNDRPFIEFLILNLGENPWTDGWKYVAEKYSTDAQYRNEVNVKFALFVQSIKSHLKNSKANN